MSEPEAAAADEFDSDADLPKQPSSPKPRRGGVVPVPIFPTKQQLLTAVSDSLVPGSLLPIAPLIAIICEYALFIPGMHLCGGDVMVIRTRVRHCSIA